MAENERSDNNIDKSPFKSVDLIYYINQQYQSKTIKMKLFINNKNNYIITYKDITNSFYYFLKENEDIEEGEIKDENPDDIFLDINENNLFYIFIKYFDGKGWISLQENEIIYINEDITFDKLKIMIKVLILTNENLELKKNYENIEKRIQDIYDEINENKKESDDIDSNTNLNLVVLTANPLMGKEIKEEIIQANLKELRTMNDFNIIPAKIYELLEEENKLKYTEFWPLTEETFKNVIFNDNIRPKILHLICKSVYQKTDSTKDNCDSSNYVNLVFEEKYDYIMKLMNKNDFQEIFKDNNIKDKIKDITLIISTQLAEDVYDIFKSFGFKNILVQHATLANLSFLANFNYDFYQDIILNLENNIFEIYQDALKTYIDKIKCPTFCCCFHKHKNNCNLLNNLKNELFNDNEIKSEIEKLSETIPHFFHLWPKCQFDSMCNEQNFCFHKGVCSQRFKLSKFKKQGKIYNNCCCLNKTPHNINHVFWKDFTEREKNNRIKFKKTEVRKEKKYIPDYKIMNVLVGYNQIVYDILKYFDSKEIYFNIYGNDINNLEELGNIIIEYYKERHNSQEEGKKKKKKILSQILMKIII